MECRRLPRKQEDVWHPSEMEMFDQAVGDAAHDPNSCLTMVRFFLGCNRTKELTCDEIEIEFSDWLTGKQLAFDTWTGQFARCVSVRDGECVIERSSGTPKRKTELIQTVRERFLIGEWVIEDGNRDPGGWGQKVASKVIKFAVLVEAGRMMGIAQIEAQDDHGVLSDRMDKINSFVSGALLGDPDWRDPDVKQNGILGMLSLVKRFQGG